ncbi:ras-related and estrogen-regulated growth inhibitor-like, partial [Oncorhynchus masou masou]|uniref:ras-related and estrogen-regulated growth inhibitor-like n=1 Tax=Oncorhynchus masou masou TaxID=90313 RepID=UPI0031837043
VRYITKRFIGEYDHQKGVTYRCWKTVDKETIDFEILDTANKESVGSAAPSLERSIKWADGFQIMYSITDRSSFESVSHLKRMSIDHVKQTLGIPTVIVVNKCDMENGGADRRRKGPASDLRCSFFELSAAECSVAVKVAVEKLVREVRLEYQRHLLAMDSHSCSPAVVDLQASGQVSSLDISDPSPLKLQTKTP